MISDDVDTKCDVNDGFGNDSGVDTKCIGAEKIGNSGFVRVRRRKLKGGHPDMRAYRASRGTVATASVSFDLVRAVRVNGKPRHKFIFGLGSQKDHEHSGALFWFWLRAIRKMKGHEVDLDQRRRLAAEMVRKGARLPTATDLEEFVRGWGPMAQPTVDEIAGWGLVTTDKQAS